MEFRILGPLSVVDGGEELALGAAKQRALLALLLLHRNEAVASERLIDWLWAGRPPAAAPKSLQVYVSGLRKVLGAERLETRGRSYLLRVEPNELDLLRFERLVAESHVAEPTRAAELLRQALGLFTGDPLPELRYDEAALSEIARLEELRLHTVEERIEADLALGRHAELVSELEGLAAAQPLRERLRGQQMLALYRSGRQADALEAYRHAQRVLDEELGLQPGPALAQLQRQILEHDPALDLASASLVVRVARRPVGIIAVGAALGLAAGIAAAVVALTGNSSRLASVAANSVGVIDPGSNRLAAQIPVGSSPTAIAFGARGVWVASAADQTIAQIDPKRKRVVRVVSIGRTPNAVAVGRDAVWVANPIGQDGTVSRVVPGEKRLVSIVSRTGQSDLFAPPTPSAIAVGGRGVWVNSNPRGLLVYLSAGSPTVAHFFLGRAHSVDGIAVGDGAVWVASGADDSVLRFDPATRLVKTIPVAGAGQQLAGPYGIAFGDSSIWVTNSLANTVSRIDPRLEGVVATIPVGPRPTNVAVGEGGVWVLNRGNGTVSRIDPKRNRVTSTIHVGAYSTGIAVGAGAVWVTVAGGSAQPSRVLAPRLAPPLPASSCAPVVSGPGRPQFLIASDLPRFLGQRSAITTQMQQAIRLVLEQHGFQAGPYTVGYQACDDSSAAAGDWDPARCAVNARAYAANTSVLALIGAYNSGCTGIELPTTNASPSGPLATISPSNTYPGLTTSGPATTPLEPDEYYPTGVRSFVRLVGNDQAQGAADALLAAELGLKRIYLLDDGTGTAVADATYTARAAARLGLRVVGHSSWRPFSNQYRPLARTVAATRPDGIYVSGCICANGIQLFSDLKAAVGPHVAFFGPDNVSDGRWFGQFPTAGLYESIAEPAATKLNTAARRCLAAFRSRYGSAGTGSIAVAQAAEIVLDAIGRSNGTRASVTRQLLAEHVVAGPLGTFRFDQNGDTTRNSFSIYRFPAGSPTRQPPYQSARDEGGVLDRVIIAPPDLAQPLR